jgi:hypothetical protein
MRRRSIVTGLAVLALALTAASVAAGQGTTQVTGIQAPVGSGPCWNPSAVASYTMDGDLTGCWYADELTCHLQPSGTVQCTGHEHFVGSIGGKSGTLYFAIEFSGKYDGPPTYAEIHGRCHHPILGGNGDFAGATGELNFKDDVTTGLSPYAGHISL